MKKMMKKLMNSVCFLLKKKFICSTISSSSQESIKSLLKLIKKKFKKGIK